MLLEGGIGDAYGAGFEFASRMKTEQTAKNTELITQSFAEYFISAKLCANLCLLSGKTKNTMKYNNNWLKAQLEAGERIKYLFFWGDHPNKDGSIGKSCLSQWFERSFTYEGISFPTAEHWMMAEKARLFEDDIRYEQILNCNTAAEAKKLGRQVQNFDQTTWTAHRFAIVMKGNLLKFGQNKDLGTFLKNTKNRVLVEASPVDSIWGIGRTADAKSIETPATWKGLNLLGYALMEVRDQLNED